MAAPTASPTVKSTIGLQGMVIAPVTADSTLTHTYGTLQSVAGIINATISPNNTDPDIQYADDIEFDKVTPDPDVSFNTTLADLPLAIQEMIYGARIDNNGVLVQSANDDPPYFAVGFKSEKADHTYRYVWLYKCRAVVVSDTYNTKEGDTITRQTPEVNWTAIKRTHDNLWRVTADEGQNGFTTQMAATFLESVYEPTFTP